MAAKHTSAKYRGHRLPNCDICHARACVYDGKTKHGPWAYMCEPCYTKNGMGLGLGLGQRLVLVSP